VASFLALSVPGCDASIPGSNIELESWNVEEALKVTEFEGRTTPLLSIGSLDVADTLMAFSQPQVREIVAMTPAGKVAWTFGGEGDGPGEFRSMGRIGWRGDTLYVVDPAVQRVTYVSKAGELLATQSWTPPALEPGLFSSGPWNILRDGTAATLPGYAADALAEGRIRRIPLLRVSPDGAVLDTLALVSQEGSQLALGDRNQPFFTVNPFSDATLFAFRPDGEGVVVVERRVPFTPDAAAFQVTYIDAVGDTVYSRSYRYQPEVMEAGVYEETLRGLWEDLGGGDGPFSRLEVERAVPRPPYHVPVTSVRVGRDGRVWLRGQPRGDHQVEWSVINAAGALEAELLLPARLTVLYADSESIYGMSEDRLDVPSLLHYRLRPP